MPLWTGLHACHRRRRGRASHLTGSGGRPADLGTGDLHDKIIGRYSNLGEPHGPKTANLAGWPWGGKLPQTASPDRPSISRYS